MSTFAQPTDQTSLAADADAVPARTLRLAGQIIEIARSEDTKPGERLYEHRLAQRLGVSRGPVRGALRYLAGSGLTRSVPNKGFILVQPLDSDLARQALAAADLGERQYMTIAEDRLEGRLPDLVSEAELCRRYGLKRTDLLRLLDRIAAEGWVERSPGYGWKFTQTLSSPDAYAQTGRLRMMIEPAGILEPTFRFDPDLMGVVREHQRRIIEGGSRVFTPPELFRFGCEFHEAVAHCSGNMFILDTIRRINRVRRLFAYRLIPDLGRLEAHTTEHLKIIDLLEAGERQKAAGLMREHLLWSGGGRDIATGRASCSDLSAEAAQT